MTHAKKRILSVTVKRMVDESPDTSWLGEYSNHATSEFSLDRAFDEFRGLLAQGEAILDSIEARLNMEYEDLNDTLSEDVPATHWLFQLETAMTTIQEIRHENFTGDGWNHSEYRYFNPSFNYVDKNGHAVDGNTPDEVRKYVRQDYERMESLHRGDWAFIGVGATAEVVLTGSTVQRVTSGGLWGIESDSKDGYIESEEKNQLADLKRELLALGFSKRAIAVAFRDVRRKDS